MDDGPSFNRPWVLVVDDDPDFQTMVTSLLEREGIPVASAFDGAEAVNLCVQARQRPAAVVLDLKLPKLEGEAALALLRQAHGNQSELPVIVVSGALLPDELEPTARRLGAVTALAKPCDLELLLAAINQVLFA